MNIHEKLWEYLMTCPELNSYLTFNSSENILGSTSIATNYNTAWEKRYQRNHGIKRYDFAFVMYRQYDTGTSTLNINEIFDAEKFMDWIDKQDELQNFPDFGENIRVLSIENLQNMPNLAAVDQNGATAKYMIQCRVRYYE